MKKIYEKRISWEITEGIFRGTFRENPEKNSIIVSWKISRGSQGKTLRIFGQISEEFKEKIYGWILGFRGISQ